MHSEVHDMPKGTTRPRCPRNQAFPTLLRLIQQQTEDCIEWPYGRDSAGYGVINMGDRFVRTHVLACTQAHGPSPAEGLVVAHGCGNSSCVNPRHLRWATETENARDKNLHGTVVHGSRHHAAKLTEDDVVNIRQTWALGASFSEIGRHYGIHRVHVRNIVRRKAWARVP